MPDDPVALIERHGADAVRYWSANGRPGMDMAFDEGQMKICCRLSLKMLNASKFALRFGSTSGPAVTEPPDRSLIVALALTAAHHTHPPHPYHYAPALHPPQPPSR